MSTEKRSAGRLDDIIASLPKAERNRIDTRARELIAEEMTLQELRKAMNKTQVALAKRLKIGQESVSKIETRTDMLISTLRSYLKAMGGELALVATFPGRPPVRVERLGILGGRSKREPRAAA